MLDRTQNSLGHREAYAQYLAHTPTADSMMSEVLNTLRNIDLQHDAELQQLENSSADEELKNDIRGKLLAKHRERRGPYVDLLTELRKHLTTSVS
ncbi:MAG TPA: hypothetical protein VEQ63_00275 [Bryobacteraceae bacterium]|nr:hypothetical protein [Bryobacteraceae bacterium]